VISANTGHNYLHDAGAIESIGHKIISIKYNDGKIRVNQIDKIMEEYWDNFSREHTVQPGMVYIN